MQANRAMFISLAFLLPFLAGTGSYAGGNTQNESFSKAKKLLHKEVFSNHRETFYCGCKFDEKKHIDFSTCGYKPKGTSKCVGRIDWGKSGDRPGSFLDQRMGATTCPRSFTASLGGSISRHS